MVHSLNWAGNVSNKGIAESCGITANYLYRPEETEARTLNYIGTNPSFDWSERVEQMLPQ